ncbi:MFS transporter [Xanthomonas hyacinthi]
MDLDDPSLQRTVMQLGRRRAALAAAYLGTFLATLDISIVNVALPTLQTALHTDIAGLQWVVSAYAICLSAFMLSAGPVGDRYGHKRAWMVGVVLFTAGSALCAMAHSLDVLLAGRAVQGVAGALLIPGALPILTHAFPDPKERAQVIGGWSAFSALALILGPLLGGVLLHVAGWQAIFLINLPLGLAAVGLGLWGITERRHPDHAALDPVGQILSVVCLGALTYGLIAAGEHGFNAVATWVALTLSLIALVVFAIVERRVRRPLLPLALFRERAFVIANFASFMLGFSYYSSLFFFSIFLQQIQGWSPMETGWRMMPQFVLTGCMSIMFGRLSAAFPIRRLMVAGYGLIALSMSTMVVFTAQTSYWIVGLLFGLLGIGAGLAVPATGMVVMNAAPAERSGTASATMNALRQTGMTIGIAFLGTLMSNRAIHVLSDAARDQGLTDAIPIARQAVTHHVLPSALPQLSKLYLTAMESGFHAAMLFAGLGCAIAMILLLTVRSTLDIVLEK